MDENVKRITPIFLIKKAKMILKRKEKIESCGWSRVALKHLDSAILAMECRKKDKKLKA